MKFNQLTLVIGLAASAIACAMSPTKTGWNRTRPSPGAAATGDHRMTRSSTSMKRSPGPKTAEGRNTVQRRSEFLTISSPRPFESKKAPGPPGLAPRALTWTRRETSHRRAAATT